MSDYPALAEMGINGINEIKRYTVIQDQKDRDILRISYKRKKGSMLPKRKTFHFGRSSKMVNDSNVSSGRVEIYEISPFLQKAMLELDGVIGNSSTQKDKVDALIKQLEQLEQETKYATSEMKTILKDIK